MRKLALPLMLMLFSATAFAQKNVAVLEIDRRAGVASEISRDEAMEITNVIRGAAVRTLPKGQYSVMTSETVMSMGGAVAADCADENCVITIGRRIDADYIVRGTLSKFQTRYTLNVEMFETDYGNLVATADPIRSENLNDILDRSAAASANMYREFLGMETQSVTPPQRSAYVTTRVARRNEEVRARGGKVVDHFFAPKWMPPINRYTEAGWAFDLEYGQIRGTNRDWWPWGDAWWWSVDGGLGWKELGNYNGYDYDESIILGGTLNIGVMHEFVNTLNIAYGVSSGLWIGWSDYNGIGNSYAFIGFAGPIVRLRWKFIEVTYRGLVGWEHRECDVDYCVGGLGYLNQLMLGLHSSSNRRNR